MQSGYIKPIDGIRHSGFLWTVDKPELLDGTPGDPVYSESFNIGQSIWQIFLYPKLINPLEEEYFSLYVRVNCDEAFNFRYFLAVLDKKNLVIKSTGLESARHPSSNLIGHSKFAGKEAVFGTNLNQILPQDLQVVCEIQLEHCFIPKFPRTVHDNDISEIKDIRIGLPRTYLFTESMVVANHCAVLSLIFKRPNIKMLKIILENISCVAISQLLCYLHTGIIQFDPKDKKNLEILAIAYRFGVFDLYEKCYKIFMDNNFSEMIIISEMIRYASCMSYKYL